MNEILNKFKGKKLEKLIERIILYTLFLYAIVSNIWLFSFYSATRSSNIYVAMKKT